jgi:hypothetical protein
MYELSVKNCKHLCNYVSWEGDNNNDINKYIKVNFIKKWYKERVSYIKNNTQYESLQEFTAMYKMNPHRKNNKYLQNIINNFSHE